jgi:hypothetical protein
VGFEEVNFSNFTLLVVSSIEQTSGRFYKSALSQLFSQSDQTDRYIPGRFCPREGKPTKPQNYCAQHQSIPAF